MDGEEEQVEGSGACGEEGPPPPAVVLRAQVEVTEEHGGLGTHHRQDEKGQHDESKHVVHLTRPATMSDRERERKRKRTEEPKGGNGCFKGQAHWE